MGKLMAVWGLAGFAVWIHAYGWAGVSCPCLTAVLMSQGLWPQPDSPHVGAHSTANVVPCK